MDAPESGAAGTIVDLFITAGKVLLGAFLMLLGLSRFVYNIKRVAEDAQATGKANTDRINFTDGRVNALERTAAAAEEKFTALLKGHERIETKLDRLIEGRKG